MPLDVLSVAPTGFTDRVHPLLDRWRCVELFRANQFHGTFDNELSFKKSANQAADYGAPTAH